MSLDLKTQLTNALQHPQSQKKLALEITGKCVCNCFHCYAYILRKYEDMSLEDATNALQLAKELDYAQVYIVGGEPLVHKKALEICKIAHDLGLYTILVTNGYKLDDFDYCKKIVKHVDQVEISIRSNKPEIHNKIISNKAATDEFTPKENLPGGFKNAIQALANLTKVKQETGAKFKIIVNHDLYHPENEEHVVHEIIKLLYESKVKLDGLYLQIMTIAGRALLNKDKIEFFKITKADLVRALEDLGRISQEFEIKDLRIVDDPVTAHVIKDMSEIPEMYTKYFVTEYIPAVCAAGFKPNVVEDVMITSSKQKR